MEFVHKSVLLEECIEGLNIRAIAERVMGELFRTLAMHFEFSLPDTAPGQGGDSPGQAGTT